MKYELKLSKKTVDAIKEERISQRDLAKVVSDYVAQSTPKLQIAGVIDPTTADNGEYRTQIGWIDFLNKEGKAMISPLDVYKADNSILSSLREDFNHWLVTGTRIIYNPNDLQARIVHNFGSAVVQPTESQVEVPVYRDEQVEKAVKREGLKYLQALFETEDDASKLIGRLEEISKKEAKDIRIWTPDQDSRRDYPERAVGFGCNGGRFRVDGDLWFLDDSYGQSRGVSVKSAKPTARKSKL